MTKVGAAEVVVEVDKEEKSPPPPAGEGNEDGTKEDGKRNWTDKLVKNASRLWTTVYDVSSLVFGFQKVAMLCDLVPIL